MNMLTITKVEVQKKHNDRVNIYVDDEFYSGLNLDVCVKEGLKAGVELTEEKLNQIILDSDKVVALNKTVKYMQSALKTTKQIRDYLRKKEYSKIVVDYVIDKLNEYKYLDDEAYAQAYINTYGAKQGKLKLKASLLNKGVSAKIADELLETYESNIDDIMKLAIKKLGNKPKTYENLTKTMNFLASRGYEYDDIKKVINQLKENNDESWD